MRVLPLLAAPTFLLAPLLPGAPAAQESRPVVEATVFGAGFRPFMALRNEPVSDPVRQTGGIGGGAHLSWRVDRSWVVQGSMTSVWSDVEGIGDEDATATGSVTYANLRIVRAAPLTRWHWVFGVGVVRRAGDAWERVGSPGPRSLGVVLGTGMRSTTSGPVALEIGVEINSYEMEFPGT